MNYFLHVDLDAFFASVEQLDFPELVGKPVIIGGLPTDRRSVVSTCSYEARKYGVHSAMSSVQAQKLCPNGIFRHGRMSRYHEKSKEVMEIFSEFSPDIQQISIDEAFIDLTGTERLFGAPQETALKIKEVVKQKTGLTVSAGLATNKYLAKIASGINKPDGFCYIKPGEEEDFMLNLPLKKVWGIGEKTLAKLQNSGFRTTKDIHAVSLATLSQIFGNACGTFLYNAVRGLEGEKFETVSKSKSISSEKTFPYDLTEYFVIETELMQLSQDVVFRAVSEELTSKTIFIKIRYEDFTTISAQKTFSRYFYTSKDFFEEIMRLFSSKWDSKKGIRLLGVGMQNLEKATEIQGELFESENKKQQLLEKAVIEVNKKNPDNPVQNARLLF